MKSRYTPPLHFILISVILAGAFAGCGGKTDGGQGRRYELRGTIVSFDKGHQQVIISHEDVPGLMEGMTMPFTLREESAYDVMRPGDAIQAALVVDGARSWLENPVITHAAQSEVPAGAQAGPREPRPGEEVPNFTLTNQDGRRINTRDYRGHVLLVTFIYTRCPLPDYCTLMSTNFAAVNREMEKTPELARDVRLLSVSIDPENDTPKVLRSYGAAHTGNYAAEKFERWQFATGDAAEVRRMANFFGLIYDRDGEQIVHSLRTAVVAPDGKLYKVYRGNEWKPEELLRDAGDLLARR
jgi:protein SCO1/2